MVLLVLGVLVWSAVHLSPALAPQRKQALWDRLGEGPYMGLFSLGVLAGLGLMIMGWRGTQPELVYLPDPALRMPALGLTVLGFLLIGFTKSPGRIKRVVRHSQLTGVGLWAIAHLLLNGDSRSLVLFGGLLIWCVLEIVLISRREGEWVKPDAPPLAQELVGISIGLVMMAVFIFAHPWLAGMPVY